MISLKNPTKTTKMLRQKTMSCMISSDNSNRFQWAQTRWTQWLGWPVMIAAFVWLTSSGNVKETDMADSPAPVTP